MAAERHQFSGRPAGDTGEADPGVTAALGAWQRGAGSERDALLALAGTRLLVPVVAMLLARDEQTGADKESEMALPTLIGNDGRAAIVAFTGVETLTRWRPDARPVAAPAARVWQAAVAEGQSVVIDVAGPVPLVVEGARLAALAAGGPPPPPHEDPDIRAVIASIVAAEPEVAGFALAPPGDAGADLAVTLVSSDVTPARRVAQDIAGQLAGRLRHRVELSVRRP
jgi:hypothetical protein